MACADNPYIGSIDMWALTFAPAGWLFCAGQTLPVNQYQALYSLIGTTFGGGTTNFNLPDFRNRFPVGAQYPTAVGPTGIGPTGGNAQVTLTIAQMPIHTHSAVLGNAAQFAGSVYIPVQTTGASGQDPVGKYLGTPDSSNLYYDTPQAGATLAPFNITLQASQGATVTVQNTGASSPVNILPPYLTINFMICYQGIYPTRPQ